MLEDGNLKPAKVEKRTRTVVAPRPFGGRRGSFREKPVWVPGDPEAVRPVTRGETYPLFVAGVVLGFIALYVCYSKGYLLLYGDAVAHLGIARRIVDARYPGLAQLGGVWLPLPHLLMVPFIGKMELWQTGLAGAPMALLSYAASVAGVWRLARALMKQRWALVATTFYALNPNLLYLATTAMTETVFLALLVWTIVATIEGIAALRAGNTYLARVRMLLAGVLIFGQVFTRYDGWIVGAVVWCCFAGAVWKSSAEVRAKVLPMFVVFTVWVVAGPLLWFWYNAHFEHDWLDFMRGPYSAKQIERKTAPPGQHYRGWHNVAWALLFYTRTAQVDAAFWETGFGLMAAAVYGVWVQLRGSARQRHDDGPGKVEGKQGAGQSYFFAGKFALLLWVPLPFYMYSVAYGSVPIFIPQLWPHSYYNARYGMEMLPALAVYGAVAAERMETWLRGLTENWARWGAKLWQPVAMMFCVANCIGMMDKTPSVLKEGIVNASTRVPFEHQLSTILDEFPRDVPVMMSTSAHIGAVQVAGRTLKGMVSENDNDSWVAALADPAGHAAYVIAIKGDPVDEAVKAHPAGLNELKIVCTLGQPCASVYASTVWTPGAK